MRCYSFSPNRYYLTDIDKSHTNARSFTQPKMNVVSFSVPNLTNLEVYFRCHWNIEEKDISKQGNILFVRFDLEYGGGGDCGRAPSQWIK